MIAGRYDVEQDRDQRNTVGLRDVACRINAKVDLLPEATTGEAGYREQFRRLAQAREYSDRVAAPQGGWAQIWAHSPPSGTVHRRPPLQIAAGHERWWPEVNTGQQCWKACWRQPPASSNLLRPALSWHCSTRAALPMSGFG